MNYLVSIMNNIARVILAVEVVYPEGWEWLDPVVSALIEILWPILIIVGAAGMIYGVVLGVNMARADSTEKREEAKKRLINVIVGLAIIIALILFFQFFLTTVLPRFLGTN